MVVLRHEFVESDIVEFLRCSQVRYFGARLIWHNTRIVLIRSLKLSATAEATVGSAPVRSGVPRFEMPIGGTRSRAIRAGTSKKD